MATNVVTGAAWARTCLVCQEETIRKPIVDPKQKKGFTSSDARFYADSVALAAIANSAKVGDLDLSKYDIV